MPATRTGESEDSFDFYGQVRGKQVSAKCVLNIKNIGNHANSDFILTTNSRVLSWQFGSILPGSRLLYFQYKIEMYGYQIHGTNAGAGLSISVQIDNWFSVQIEN